MVGGRSEGSVAPAPQQIAGCARCVASHVVSERTAASGPESGADAGVGCRRPPNGLMGERLLRRISRMVQIKRRNASIHQR